METAAQEKVKLGTYSNHSVQFDGLSPQEAELVEGCVHGHQWIMVQDGRISAQPTYKPLPSPTEDEEMLPFWRKSDDRPSKMQEFLLDPTRELEHTSPSIFISSLCGYNYTPTNYEYQAEKLERWGFSCMRSRREPNGRFWENWYLPGLWAAQEELEDAIEKKGDAKKKSTERDKLRRAINFLSQEVSFGSLDVVVQRMAMVLDD